MDRSGSCSGSLHPTCRCVEDLSSRYEIDLFVGLFMHVFNEGFQLSADCLTILGERGVTLDVDIYGRENDPDGLLKGTIAALEQSRSSSGESEPIE